MDNQDNASIISTMESIVCNVSMYKCYRNDYKCNEGGLMVYVRHDMIQRRRHDIDKCAFNNCNGRI